VSGKRLTQRSIQRMRKREAAVGLDADDAAAEWLSAHDPKPPPPAPKSAKKSLTLHRFRQRQDHPG
jgi:hypothetical protein